MRHPNKGVTPGSVQTVGGVHQRSRGSRGSSSSSGGSGSGSGSGSGVVLLLVVLHPARQPASQPASQPPHYCNYPRTHRGMRLPKSPTTSAGNVSQGIFVYMRFVFLIEVAFSNDYKGKPQSQESSAVKKTQKKDMNTLYYWCTWTWRPRNQEVTLEVRLV